MIISFQAFSWNCKANELPINDFAQVLTSQRKPIEHRGNRYLYINKSGQYLNGLVVTIKDMRRFCTILQEEGRVRLTAHQLSRNEQVADFNFFIFDMKKCKGMYQYYYHSCSLNAFNVIAKSLYAAFLSHRKNTEIDTHDKDDKDYTKFLERMRKKYAGTLHCAIIERQGAFEERIRRMKDITAIEFEFQSLNVEEVPYAPLFPYLSKSKHTMSFTAGSQTTEKVSSIANWFSTHRMTKAKAVGLDANGEEIVYKLFHDYDKFATLDYDALVPSLSLDKDDAERSINENAIIKRLRAEYEKSSLRMAVER